VRALLPAVLAAAALAPGCVIDPYEDPLPGKDAQVVLRAHRASSRAEWPAAYRRGARFVIENRTGKPVETLVLDLSRCKRPPRELTDVEVEEPQGAPCRILRAPRGSWALRALVGEPGKVLLPDGGRAVVVLRVLGEPGSSVLDVSIPSEAEK
jgi:hypothetical protein